jgi:tripartite-type tricarboxylate transporter receptor subunit TctC
VLAVGSWIPAKNLSELVALAKIRPGQLTAGSSGSGSSSGFALEMLKGAAGIDILQVPYGGAGPALIGILSSQIDMVFADFGLVNPHVRSGALRLIATTGSRRIPVAPDLPTIREQGLDSVAVDSYIGIAAPAGIPAETLVRLSSGLNQVLRLPDVRQRLLDLGFDPVEDTPALYAAALREEIEKYSIIVRRMGLGNAK